MPLCRSTSAAKRSHVSGVSGLIVVEPGSWVAMTPTVPEPATWTHRGADGCRVRRRARGTPCEASLIAASRHLPVKSYVVSRSMSTTHGYPHERDGQEVRQHRLRVRS